MAQFISVWNREEEGVDHGQKLREKKQNKCDYEPSKHGLWVSQGKYPGILGESCETEGIDHCSEKEDYRDSFKGGINS